MIPPVLDGLPSARAYAADLAAATPKAEADAPEPVAGDSVVVVSDGESLNPVVMEHVRQSRLARWQAQR